MEVALWVAFVVNLLTCMKGLNPCYNGSSSLSASKYLWRIAIINVLILVIMEVALWANVGENLDIAASGLNPCYNGSSSLRKQMGLADAV